MVAAIRMEGLAKSFSATVALRPLDLEVGEAEVLGYLGPNGAGKTTTIRCLLGMIRASAAVGLIDPQAWRALAAVDPVEVAIAAVTTGCVVAFGVLQALIVAVGLSLIDTVRRSASPHDAVLGWDERLGRYADVSLHREARLTPGVVIYGLDDRLFFANVRYFRARVHEAIRAAPTPTSWLVFDAEAVTHADSTGLEALTTLAKDLRHEGITLVVARLRTRMQEQFQHAGVTRTIGTQNFYPSVHAAVSHFTHTGTDTTGPAA